MSYSEVHRLPIRYRNWFLRRLVKHFDQKNKAYEDARNNKTPASQTNQSLENLSRFESQIKSKF